MKLTVKVQQWLVVAHIHGDGGLWVFTICRRGFETLIGKKLKTGDIATVEVSGKLLERTSQHGKN